jgi:hypothetical protein
MQDQDSPDFIDPIHSPANHRRRKSGVSYPKKGMAFAAISEDKKGNKNVKESGKIKGKTNSGKGGEETKPPKKNSNRSRSKKISSVPSKRKTEIKPKSSSPEKSSKGADKQTKSCKIVITPFVEAKKKWDDAVGNSKQATEDPKRPSLSDLSVNDEKSDPIRRKLRNNRVKKTLAVDLSMTGSSNDEIHEPQKASRNCKKEQRSSAGKISQQSGIGTKRRSSDSNKQRTSVGVRRMSSAGGAQQTSWNLNEIEKFKM